MKWVQLDKEFFNLSHFFHIWTTKCPNGWYAEGEITTGEEIVLTPCFPSEEECLIYIRTFLTNVE